MLKNKVVVVAGGSGLLGKAFAKALLNEEAHVIILDTCAVETWQAARIEGSDFIKSDITNRRDILAAIGKTQTKFNKIDGFVNAAYPKNQDFGKHFFDVSYRSFVENVGMHLGGYFLASQVFADFFKNQGFGSIVNIASIYGTRAPSFEIYDETEMTMPVEYAVTKAGIIQLTKYIAKYLKGTNVRINCISPGGIYDHQPEPFVKAYNQKCLTKGLLDRADINGTLVFLLSDLSAYINGQNIIVDDGFTL